jgi:hypothetical protein
MADQATIFQFGKRVFANKEVAERKLTEDNWKKIEDRPDLHSSDWVKNNSAFADFFGGEKFLHEVLREIVLET